MSLHPVILAGGSGTRLWPLSREYYPKQFLSLMGQRSLLQETVCRLDGIDSMSPPIVVCNEEHRFLVAEHIRQLGKPSGPIILEPDGRNTAPALTLAALFLRDTCQCPPDGDPVMLVTPADHVIRDVSTFQAVVKEGAALAQKGYLVTFGIVPSSAKTGFGYIKQGAPVAQPVAAGAGAAVDGVAMSPFAFEPHLIERFVEKPNAEAAAEMVQSGEYFWNSGIFMMKVSVWLEQLGKFRPDILTACADAHKEAKRDGDFLRPDSELFKKCPGDSIDYAVMEKVGTAQSGDTSGAAPLSVVLPLDAGWSDLGAFSSLWEEVKKDENDNYMEGDVHSYSMKRSLMIGQHRLVAAVGLEDVIIVETSDAVLVAHKDHVDDVKALVSQLKAKHRTEQMHHRKVHRPWGSYEVMDGGPRFQVKRLTVKPGAALSLQMHHHRAEHWVVVNGTAKVTRGDETFLLTEDKSSYVPVGVTHRLENPGSIPLEIIEVQSGSYLGEDDIVRLEDKYNRTGTKPER
jgi:mannose-1-phosphate guanylyltransferase/mannose-6-phosphate isomerase